MLSGVSSVQQFARKAIITDLTSNSIQFDAKKCFNCQSCVKACKTVAGQFVLKSMKVDEVGRDVVQTASGKHFNETNCIGCGQCTLGCKPGALKEKDSIKAVNKVLKNKQGKVCVCAIAPAIRINMAEALGVPAGEISTGKVVTALKKLGFDYVFDTNFAADMTIVEEATELIQRLQDPNATLPMFTSCCPAWVNYVEKVDPSMIPHLSSCRSPNGMLSSVIKNIFPKMKGIEASKIYNVSIMPCTAKKDEIRRPQLKTKEGLPETDEVITSRELAKMIKSAKIDFKSLPDTPFDNFGEATGGGAIFCATGGVMEAAVRAAHKFLTNKDLAPIDLEPVRGTKDGIKTATVEINGNKINVAVAQGVKNAMKLIKNIKTKAPGFENITFCEVMACPGGCVAGGGSPKAKTKKALQKRLDATYKIDKSSKARTSQDNNELNSIYKEFIGGKYGSHQAHELLHTHFTARKV